MGPRVNIKMMDISIMSHKYVNIAPHRILLPTIFLSFPSYKDRKND